MLCLKIVQSFFFVSAVLTIKGHDNLDSYLFRKFGDCFTDFRPLFEHLSHIILDSKQNFIKNKSEETQIIKLKEILSFIYKSDFLAVFLQTYITELKDWLERYNKSQNEFDIFKIIKNYRIQLDSEITFWKSQLDEGDWVPCLNAIHCFFLVSEGRKVTPIDLNQALTHLPVAELKFLLQGFSVSGKLSYFEKILLKEMKAIIIAQKNLGSLFQIYLWIRLLDRKGGICDTNFSNIMFEGLEIILEDQFSHFELYLVPEIYKRCIMSDISWDLPKESSSFPNPFDTESVTDDSLTIKEIADTLKLDPSYQFWFLIKLMFLVSDKSQMFKEIYTFFFERKVRNISE